MEKDDIVFRFRAAMYFNGEVAGSLEFDVELGDVISQEQADEIMKRYNYAVNVETDRRLIDLVKLSSEMFKPSSNRLERKK